MPISPSISAPSEGSKRLRALRAVLLSFLKKEKEKNLTALLRLGAILAHKLKKFRLRFFTLSTGD